MPELDKRTRYMQEAQHVLACQYVRVKNKKTKKKKQSTSFSQTACAINCNKSRTTHQAICDVVTAPDTNAIAAAITSSVAIGAEGRGSALVPASHPKTPCS